MISEEIINSYEIKSNGPSTIEQLTVSFYLPIAHKKADSSEVQHIINITSLKMQATHDSKVLPIKLYDHNNNLLIVDTTDNYTHNELEEDDHITYSIRKRRDLNEPVANLKQSALVKTHDLPVNRTIVFNCQYVNTTICVRAEMSVQLKPDKPISLNVRLIVDLTEVVGPWEYFVVLSDLELLKKEDPTSSSLVINKNIEPNVIFRHLRVELPIWYIIWSLIGGFLLLCAITYALYKVRILEAKKELIFYIDDLSVFSSDSLNARGGTS